MFPFKGNYRPSKQLKQFFQDMDFKQDRYFDENKEKSGKYCTQFMDYILNFKNLYANIRITWHPLPAIGIHLYFDVSPLLPKCKYIN